MGARGAATRRPLPPEVGIAELFEFWIEANSFLRGMIRALIGTMLEVSSGRRDFDDFTALLAGGARKEAGDSARAAGPLPRVRRLLTRGSGEAALDPAHRIDDMRVLITNDDGIGAKGLQALRRALAEVPELDLSVIAPDSNRSATARSITTRSPLWVEEITFDDGTSGFATDGTPSTASASRTSA